MTSITFESEGSRLVSLTLSGHSGFADAGADILCAAITSAVRLIECALNDVMGLEVAIKQREQDAFLSLKLPNGLPEETESLCQTLLASAMVYFVQLSEEYPDHLIVLEV